jgi:uncharacterized membrane protein YhhN
MIFDLFQGTSLMPSGFILGFAFLLAILNWIAVHLSWRQVDYFSKPSVILVLLAWTIMSGGDTPQLWWFSIALIFSFVGDTFLLFSTRYFLIGLCSFLLAQIAFVFGLNPSFPPINLASLVLFLLIGFTIFEFYRLISTGQRLKAEKKLQIPCLIYSISIGLMVFSALVTMVRPEKEWQIFSAILASIGALLFLTSDTLHAWTSFVTPIHASKILVRITYHLAQFTLIYAAVTNYT